MCLPNRSGVINAKGKGTLQGTAYSILDEKAEDPTKTEKMQWDLKDITCFICQHADIEGGLYMHQIACLMIYALRARNVGVITMSNSYSYSVKYGVRKGGGHATCIITQTQVAQGQWWTETWSLSRNTWKGEKVFHWNKKKN